MRRGDVTPPAAILSALVVAYQWTLRPVIGSNCRFEPSCSCYALGALRTHGAARGSLLAGRRILRCNPWCAGGDDPVPPAREIADTPHSLPDRRTPA